MSMLGARQLFRSFRKSSPALPYDAEVKWLESTGTQWIDTGISIARDLYCEVSFCLTVEPGSYDNAPFGANNGRTWIAFASRQGTAKVLYCGMYSSFTGYNVGGHSYVLDDMDWHVAKIDSTEGTDNASFQLDDNEAFIRSSYTGSVTNNMYLFGCNGTGITNRAKCRIGYCKIKSTTTNQFLLDLIPVRFTNELGQSEGAMYDRVSGQLFRNQGTGKFIVGADAGMPYDHEVQYVERDWSVPWLINGSSGLGRFNLSQYLIGESQADATRAVELTWSFEPVSSDSRTALWYVINAFGTGPVLWKKNGRTDYSFYAGGEHNTGITGSLETFHVQQEIPDGSGTWRFFIDGVEAGSQTVTSTTKFNDISLMRGSYSSGSQFKMRVKSFKLGNDVDLIPVVKGDAIGFYNRVDGLLFVEEQSCLSAGPVVSNEGPVPYAYKVEYIETDGVGSYINTGTTTLLDGSQIHLSFSYVSWNTSFSTTGMNTICGSSHDGKIGSRSLSIGTNISNGIFHIVRPTFSSLPQLDTSIHDVSFYWDSNGGGIVWDGISYTPPVTTTIETGEFCLGTRGPVPTSAYPERWYSNARFYSCKIYTNNVLVFNGIPVVDRNGVACMYDYISKTLKYNAAATGTITAGPPLV